MLMDIEFIEYPYAAFYAHSSKILARFSIEHWILNLR